MPEPPASKTPASKPPATRAPGFGRTGQEFGKRRPQPLAPTPPPKRSTHVALLVMGTLAVGGTAFALIPHRTCQPQEPGATTQGQPAGQQATQPPTDTNCSSHSSSGWHSSSSHWGFFSGGSSSSSSSSTSVAESSGGISRGGFGASGHAAGGSSGS